MNSMKKTILYSLLAALLVAVAVPAGAQKSKAHRQMKNLDPDATVEALKKVIHKHQGLGEANLVETEIYPQFKKNDSVLTRIGRIYHFYINDTVKGLKFIDRALAVNPKYVPAYVEKGELYFSYAKTHEDTLAAYGWYEKAVSVDPKNPLGYQAQAKILAKSDVDAAARKLEEILQHDPNYNVYVEIGAMYASSDDVTNANKAIEAYAKVDINRMTMGHIAGYITLLQAAGKAGELGAYKRSDSLLTLALEKYPTDAKLNRLQMQNSVAMLKYDQAIAAAEVLFNKSDSAELGLDDFMLYAQAYEGLKNYNKAIEQYRKCLDFEIVRENYKSDFAFENAKRQEERKKNTAWQAIVRAYDKSGYPEKAIDEMKLFIAKREEEDKLDAPELSQLAKLYLGQAEILMGEEKIEAYKSAHAVYGKMVEVSPQNALYAHYTRVQICAAYIDPDITEGLALADAEKILELVPIDDSEDYILNKSKLEYALNYLIKYYFIISQNNNNRANNAKCGYYLRKVAQVNPENGYYKNLSSDKINRKRYGL